MSDLDFDIKGLDELQKELTKAIKKYPDKAEEKLESLSKEFKKRVVQLTKQNTNKYSGKLLKGFKLDKIRGYGVNMEKDFRGTAPHFHLIEKGHEQVTADGRNIGFVPGLYLVKQARDEFAERLPEDMQDLIDEIVKECGLD